uniref:BTB domain-containing protein n=1 Tax=Macrostomum lignano TaxID=282301 RepID=A0A1I8FXQ3_9PLAT
MSDNQRPSNNGHGHITASLSAGLTLQNNAQGGAHSRWIRLNVGGKTFVTTRSTLLQYNESFLARLVQEDSVLKSDKDEHGAFLIDRDPKYFGIVLNYLRHGKLIMGANLSLDGVLEEAEFYNITSLISLARKRREEQNRLGNSGCPLCGRSSRPVYRVFQCSEEELAPMVSTISDGWKFEQLISTGSSYNYGSSDDNHGEFLCVVSRDCSLPHSASSDDSAANGGGAGGSGAAAAAAVAK